MRVRHYETVVVTKPEVTTEFLKNFNERVENIFKSFGAELLSAESWGEKKLAYEIKKNMKGHYLYYNYLATGDLVKELERNFRMWEYVLRFLTVKLDDRPDIEELKKNAKGNQIIKNHEAQIASEEGDSSAKEEKREESSKETEDYSKKLKETLEKEEKETAEEENVEL